MSVKRSEAKKLVGKQVYAIHKNGQKIRGKLVSVRGKYVHIRPLQRDGKARTKAIIPLVLFDLLAIGTSPYGYGGYGYGGGYGYPGYSPYYTGSPYGGYYY